VGFYAKRLAPIVIDALCGSKGLASWRAKSLAGLAGAVVEVGFGSGTNLAFYPDEVTDIFAVEPSAAMRERSMKSVSSFSGVVQFSDVKGESLDLESASIDHGVISFTLCTVRDPAAVLRELRRVIKPGGQLRVLEHGLSPDDSVAKWQRRLNGFEQVVADGCQLTRDPLALCRESEWNVTTSFQRYAGPKTPWSYLTSLTLT